MADRIEHDFINSKGVFQGGGCKAVAFLGAYDAALRNGVCFTEFAGTSAGSFFAALVAAGANVGDMKRFLGSLDVKELVNKAEQHHTRAFWDKGKNYIISKCIKVKSSLVDVAFALKNNKGKFDAGIIEQILDKELQKLLNIQSQIRFRDLPYPLTIVASDVKDHTFKVWNKTRTPDFPVAKAVSCSCAIPGYFIPVDDRYVDGGMLANLPVSFFDDNSDDYSTVLAFTLTYKEEEKGKNDMLNYLLNIASTVINGATELQLKSFRNNVFIVPVATKLGLLDFDKLDVNGKDFNESIKEGFNSFRSFLKDYKNAVEYEEQPLSRNQYLVKVASCSCRSHNKVVAIVDNYQRVFQLFLTIVKWRNKSKDVCVYIQYTDQLGNSNLDYAIKLMAHMGVKVYVVYEEIPVLGYFFKSSKRWRGIAVKKIGNDYKAQYYNSEIEGRMISNYLNGLKNKHTNVQTYALNRLSLQKYDETDLINRLKHISQYKNCTLTFMEISLEDLFFMHDFVYGYKYRAIDELVRLYKESNLELFSSAQFVLANNHGSIITPPIIEIHEEKKYVISGLTRLFYAYKQGISKVQAVVVEDCTSPLPLKNSVTMSKLKIKDTPFDIKEKVSFRYDNKNYRRIENVLRPMQNCFTDLN